MDLTNFPMDSVSCMLTFESYNYNIDEVRMKWNEPHAVLMFKDIELPDFTLVNYTTTIIEAVMFFFCFKQGKYALNVGVCISPYFKSPASYKLQKNA